MLDRFKVPLADQVRVSDAALRQTVAAIFEKCNLTPEDAAIGADVLVTTDLRGVESHGVSNMLRSYVQSYQNGNYNPRPNWRIVRESPSTATIDGDGPGPDHSRESPQPSSHPAHGVLAPTHPVWRGVARPGTDLLEDQFRRSHDQSARGGPYCAGVGCGLRVDVADPEGT